MPVLNRLLERPGRYDGPPLPRISTHRTAEGTLLATVGAEWRDLREQILVSIAFLVCMTAVVVGGLQNRIELRPFLLGLSALTILIVGLQRYLAKRRLLRATLLVHPWPIRLGDEVEVRFRATLRKAAPDSVLTANLECAEEVTSGSGRNTRNRRAALYEIDLQSSQRLIDGRKLSHLWRFTVPDGLPPSFCVPSNAVRWLLSATITTEHVQVPAVFELLVLPEVAE